MPCLWGWVPAGVFPRRCLRFRPGVWWWVSLGRAGYMAPAAEGSHRAVAVAVVWPERRRVGGEDGLWAGFPVRIGSPVSRGVHHSSPILAMVRVLRNLLGAIERKIPRIPWSRGCGRLKGVAGTAGKSPTVISRRLGKALQRLREDAGLTMKQVAKELDCSDARIQRIERGEIKVKPGDVLEFMRVYQPPQDVQEDLVELSKRVKQEGWWAEFADALSQPLLTYLGFESEARRILAYELGVVHGLLQTEDYARAVEQQEARLGTSAEEVDRRVQARMARRINLDRTDPLLDLRVVLDEGVLRRQVGGPAVLRDQLDYLANLVDRHPNVRIQVLPFTVGKHAGTVGSFTIFQFPDPADRDIAMGNTVVAGDRSAERPEEVERLVEAFQDLCALALNPDNSVALIREVAQTL